MQLIRVQDVVQLMRMEYAEMPGLQLTFWQAQRLWNLSEEQCQVALGDLMQSGFLVKTSAGLYARPRSEPHAGVEIEGRRGNRHRFDEMPARDRQSG